MVANKIKALIELYISYSGGCYGGQQSAVFQHEFPLILKLILSELLLSYYVC